LAVEDRRLKEEEEEGRKVKVRSKEELARGEGCP